MKIIPVLIIAILMAAIITALSVAGTQQDLRSRASDSKKLPQNIRLSVSNVTIKGIPGEQIRISWNTVMPSLSEVEYGIEKDVLDKTVTESGIYKSKHDIDIKVEPNSRYYFRIRAKSSDKQEFISDIYNFKPS